MFGNDQDDILIAPWTTVKYRISNQSGQLGRPAGGGRLSTAASAASSSTAVNTLSNLYPSTSGGNRRPVPGRCPPSSRPTPRLHGPKFSNVDQVICAAGSAAGVQRSVDEITALLHQRHHMGGDHVENDFRVQSATAFADMLGSRPPPGWPACC